MSEINKKRKNESVNALLKETSPWGSQPGPAAPSCKYDEFEDPKVSYSTSNTPPPARPISQYTGFRNEPSLAQASATPDKPDTANNLKLSNVHRLLHGPSRRAEPYSTATSQFEIQQPRGSPLAQTPCSLQSRRAMGRA